MQLYDAFISHASEDKDDFVRPLAQRLDAEHISVWYDEFELKVGDSLRRSIDRGLAQSRFGIVVLSPSFLSKQWPQRELDGLVARETASGTRVILPIWHRIGRDEVLDYSPPLADLRAVLSTAGLDEVVRELKRVIRPQGSPLIAARDRLIDFGIKPPVVTDEWWLDVVEATSRVTPWGMAVQERVWGRWTFPLPEQGTTPEDRGERIAWTALQMRWEEEAERRRICQMTPSEEVIAFIESQPGLMETALDFPHFLATYAPQLTILGLGGPFETAFDELLAGSMKANERHRGTTFGSALTTTAQPPGCEEYIALRHPTFGYYHASSIACQFVQGDIGGPPCKTYPTMEYVVWLLSRKSAWLPKRARAFLTRGMAEWPTWLWFESFGQEETEHGLSPYPGMGKLSEAIFAAEESGAFVLTKAARSDLTHRIDLSRPLLSLPEAASTLVRRFLDAGFIEGYIAKRRKLRDRKPITES